MLRLALDENFNNDILRGVLRRNPTLNIMRVQDAGLARCDDPTVLDWAARENRVLFTHDVSTMTKYAYWYLHKSASARFSAAFLPLLLTKEGGEGRGEEARFSRDSPLPIPSSWGEGTCVDTNAEYAEVRVNAGQKMPGLFEVGQTVPMRRAIEDILLIAECSREAEWEGQIRYLPL